MLPTARPHYLPNSPTRLTADPRRSEIGNTATGPLLRVRAQALALAQRLHQLHEVGEILRQNLRRHLVAEIDLERFTRLQN